VLQHSEEEPVERMNISKSAETVQADSIVSCNFCDQKFETRRSLMFHKKSEHIDKVAPCWNFSSGVGVWE
jgi:hypothetical protein